MEEVRSYWQVASITHFCTLFGKPFKLPTFEPEELEQAFIIDVPEPPKSANNNSNNQNNISNLNLDNNHNGDLELDDEQKQPEDVSDSPKRFNDDPLFQPPPSLTHQIQQQQQQVDEQQELHLLVKLGIALLKPHFNSKIW